MMGKHPWLCAALAVVLALTGTLGLLAAPAAAQTGVLSNTAYDAPVSKEPEGKHHAGAAAANIVYVPGKVILCTLGTVVSAVVLLATFGTGYSAAGKVFDEGCGGEWVLTPEHASGKIPPRSDLD
ncbi:MAG TPA: hypothetical protein VML54_12920 [Candidatus Limnocylindrales bacterium]|nr:hypothetical protein [Candidatus Limnocylindrales bacterium]